jgi:hypothetical protein
VAELLNDVLARMDSLEEAVTSLHAKIEPLAVAVVEDKLALDNIQEAQTLLANATLFIINTALVADGPPLMALTEVPEPGEDEA